VLHRLKYIFFTKLLFFSFDSLVGTFTCIEVHLALQRNINLYLQQLYLPSTLIVTLSFIAFWIDYKSHPARTLLSLLSIVTIATKAEGTKYILYFLFYLDIYTHIHIRALAFSACTVFPFSCSFTTLISNRFELAAKYANEESFLVNFVYLIKRSIF
jgi:hypothetical protein